MQTTRKTLQKQTNIQPCIREVCRELWRRQSQIGAYRDRHFVLSSV